MWAFKTLSHLSLGLLANLERGRNMNFSILLLCDLVIYFTIVWKYKVNSLLYQKLYANYTFKLRIHYYLIVSYIHLGILQKDSYIFEIIGRYWKLYIFEYLLVEEKLLNLRSNIAWKQWNKMISLMKIFELVLFSFLLWFEIKWGINNNKKNIYLLKVSLLLTIIF